MTRRLRLKALLLALCLGGCAAVPTPDVNTFAQRSANNSFEVFHRGFHTTALVLPVVHDRQTSGPSCGAHALASVVNYWEGPNTVSGDEIFRSSPPASPMSGYSLAELITLARGRGLLANGMRLSQADLVNELESGRPVLVPVRLPAIYIEPRTLPGANTPVVGVVSDTLTYRVGRVSELIGRPMANHYLLIVGYDHQRFAVVEPVLGYRTISFTKLARYRRPFDNAAIVFSAPNQFANGAAVAAAH